MPAFRTALAPLKSPRMTLAHSRGGWYDYPMMIRTNDATHIARMMRMIESDAFMITMDCPECDRTIDRFDDAHLIIVHQPIIPGPIIRESLIIACEGYHIHDEGGKIKPLDE